jgi:hypothetical protein
MEDALALRTRVHAVVDLVLRRHAWLVTEPTRGSMSPKV